MNVTRIVLASLAAFVAYFMVGGIFFVFPAFKTEFEKYPAVFRSGDASKSVMLPGMLGILLAIGAAGVIFAQMHPAGAGIGAGAGFGALLAVFVIGSFVLHNYMLLNIGRRLSMLQAIGFTVEWIAVGIVISLVYSG